MVISDPRFYKKLLQVSSDVQMKPEDLLNVMALESGVDTHARNKGSNASGLLQFMPATLKGLGFQGSHGDFRSLSPVDQLDYVKKLILNNMRYNGGPFTSAAQYYVANFLPVALKLPGIKSGDPGTIIAALHPKQPHLPGVSSQMESEYYKANPDLDADHDGAITFGDIQTVLGRVAKGQVYHDALANLHNSTGYQPKQHQVPAPSMVATNDTEKLSPFASLMSVLEHYLQEVLATEKLNRRLYKEALPTHNLLIRVDAPNYETSMEFARVLSMALKEDLLAKAFIHSNGSKLEVECHIQGPIMQCQDSVQGITNIVSKAFNIATQKIGSPTIKTKLLTNKTSSYQPVSPTAFNTEHQKFLTKFL